jgi:hypothetical protein
LNTAARQFQRYADLIRRQADALAADDLDEVAKVAAERERLAARINHTSQDLDADARAMLAQCVELDKGFVAMLTAMRNTAFQDLKASEQRRPSIRAYGSAPVGGPAFDRRL